jgi:hypothetical protein
LAVATLDQVAEHGRRGSDQGRHFPHFRAWAEGVHGDLSMKGKIKIKKG